MSRSRAIPRQAITIHTYADQEKIIDLFTDDEDLSRPDAP